jgi:copper chaperone CopZ
MVSFLKALHRLGNLNWAAHQDYSNLPHIPFEGPTQEVTILLWGMGCPACARLVRSSAIALQGVIDAEVDCFTGIAHVTFNPEQTTADAVVDAAARAGNRKEHRYIVLDVI